MINQSIDNQNMNEHQQSRCSFFMNPNSQNSMIRLNSQFMDIQDPHMSQLQFQFNSLNQNTINFQDISKATEEPRMKTQQNFIKEIVQKQLVLLNDDSNPILLYKAKSKHQTHLRELSSFISKILQKNKEVTIQQIIGLITKYFDHSEGGQEERLSFKQIKIRNKNLVRRLYDIINVFSSLNIIERNKKRLIMFQGISVQFYSQLKKQKLIKQHQFYKQKLQHNKQRLKKLQQKKMNLIKQYNSMKMLIERNILIERQGIIKVQLQEEMIQQDKKEVSLIKVSKEEKFQFPLILALIKSKSIFYIEKSKAIISSSKQKSFQLFTEMSIANQLFVVTKDNLNQGLIEHQDSLKKFFNKQFFDF